MPICIDVMVSEFIYKVRLKLCKQCPIYSKEDGGTCSDKLYLNPITNKVTSKSSKEFIRGCGCKLRLKAKWEDEKCPAGKW